MAQKEESLRRALARVRRRLAHFVEDVSLLARTLTAEAQRTAEAKMVSSGPGPLALTLA